MRDHQASHTALITSLLLLLVAIISVNAQSRKSGRQEQRGVNVVPTVPAPPTAERRIALVIGNSSYAASPLANPVNDAIDIATALQQMGFAVTPLLNADLRRMRDGIETFRKQLRPGVVGLFYFAGHGLQIKGENYLVPIGAQIARDQDVEFETVDVWRILGAMEEADNGINIIILDACRNNPFARSLRSSQRGLAVTQAITGSLIAYATAPGATAADGSGRNGVYTSHLLHNMRIPGLPIEQVFKNVRVGVIKETSGKQTPWESSSLTGHIAFIPVAQQEQGKAMTGTTAPLGSSPSLGDLQAQVEEQRQQVQAERQRLEEERRLREEQQKLQAEQERLRQEREKLQGGRAPQGTQVAVGVYPQQPAAPRTLRNSINMELVLIQAGTFQMGSNAGDDEEKPVHTIRLSRPFYLGKYEVTQAQWEAVMGNNPSKFKGDLNRPVENVSWDDVQEFIRRLNAKEDGARYRLPTEAEWEYAARAGSTTAYSFGGSASQLGQSAWYGDNAGTTTHPVGQLQPNAWGLYDMHGNVWEWVQDWRGSYASDTVTDPTGPHSGSSRVYRGGSWFSSARLCRSASRSHDAPGSRASYLGFRLLREVP
jgi:formylglycine-generating enzyme required for sulfatase activity